MAKSVSYYMTLLVLRLKGIKSIFRQDPINYTLLRKEDVRFPGQRFFRNKTVNRFKLMNTIVTEIKGNSGKLLIYIPGGAFVSGPSRHHWSTIRAITNRTDFTVWVCDYPKAPENKIAAINNNIDFVFETARNNNSFHNIVVAGDSAGATLLLTLIQRIIPLKVSLPSKLILISPVADASFDNPEIRIIEKKDPMLAVQGVVSAKKMCIADNDLKNKIISPLFGDFHGFPGTYLFLAENDISYPDQLLLCRKLKEQGIEHSVETGSGMPHIWPLLPFMKESKNTLNRIVQLLNQ